MSNNTDRILMQIRDELRNQNKALNKIADVLIDEHYKKYPKTKNAAKATVDNTVKNSLPITKEAYEKEYPKKKYAGMYSIEDVYKSSGINIDALKCTGFSIEDALQDSLQDMMVFKNGGSKSL